MRKNAKHAATVSLAAMGAGFAATFPIAHLPFGFVLQSGFEAGLVGGLADWFAVTALFRHPLGIPIPHTALLPRNREKVTDALVRAIQTNLLNKDSIIGKLKQFDIVRRLAGRAQLELEREDAGEALARLLGGIVREIPREAAANALSRVAREAIRSVDERALLVRLGESAAEAGFAEPVFDYALTQGERFAATEEMRRRLGAMALRSIDQLQLGGFMGFAVNAFAGFMNEDKLGGMLQEFIMTFLYDLRKPGHPHREAALEALRGAMLGLGDNDKVLEEARRLKSRLALGPEEDREDPIAAFAGNALDALERRLSNPEYCRDNVVPLLRSALERIMAKEELIAKADGWIRDQAASFIEKNHGAIGRLVKENADKLDNEALIAMMEEHVGKDLQWIRVNGAVCGFAIGLVLGTAQWLISGGP